MVLSEGPSWATKQSSRYSVKGSAATDFLFGVAPGCTSSFGSDWSCGRPSAVPPGGWRERQAGERQPRKWELWAGEERVIRGLITVGKCKGPDPREWWRTLWRGPLRTNKDGFSFTGRMHLHSLEANASEPGLMKRNPSNCSDFNANERERETEGERQWKRSETCARVWQGAFKTLRELFSSSVAAHKWDQGHLCIPWRLSLTDFDAKGTYWRRSVSRNKQQAQRRSHAITESCSVVAFWFDYLESFGCHYHFSVSSLWKPWTRL